MHEIVHGMEGYICLKCFEKIDWKEGQGIFCKVGVYY